MLEPNNASKNPSAGPGQGVGGNQQRSDHRTTRGTPRSYLDQLPLLPEDWQFVPVGPNKAPCAWGGGDAQRGWQREALPADEFAAKIEQSGWAPPAVGVILGEPSNLIEADLDEPGPNGERAASFKAVTGWAIEDLPATVTVTSGREGRQGQFFTAPDQDWWAHLSGKRTFSFSEGPDAGRAMWELRGNGCMAVILGAHPDTDGYAWVPGRSPADVDVATAPDWIGEVLSRQEEESIPRREPTAEDATRAAEALAFIPAEEFQGYEPWLSIGMALHSADPDLREAWIDWCRAMHNFDEDECRRKWKSFGGKRPFKGRPITVGTLFHHAKAHGYKGVKQPPSAEAVLAAIEAVEIKDGVVDTEALKKVFLLAGERLALTGENAEIVAVVQRLNQKGVGIGDSRSGINGAKAAAKKHFKEQLQGWRQERGPSSDPYARTHEPADLQAARLAADSTEEFLSYSDGMIFRYDPSVGFWRVMTERPLKVRVLEELRNMWAPDEKGNPVHSFGSASQQRGASDLLPSLLAGRPSPIPAGVRPAALVLPNNRVWLPKEKKLVEYSMEIGATHGLNAEWPDAPQDSPSAQLRRYINTCYAPGSEFIIRGSLRLYFDPTAPYRRFVYIIGATGTGKGIFVELVGGCFPLYLTGVGDHPADLCSPERIAQMVTGKAFVRFDDVPINRQSMQPKSLGYFYRLVENVPVGTRDLYAAADARQHNARFLLASIDMLQMPDAESRTGWDRRALAFRSLPRIGEPDPDLKAALVGESEHHRRIRGEVVAWALSMPDSEFDAFLRGEDPEGLLADVREELHVVADVPSRWADECLGPHPLGPEAEVTKEDWHSFYECFIAWAKANHRYKENMMAGIDAFKGKVRAAVGAGRYRLPGRESRVAARLAGRTRQSTPGMDCGYALIPGLFFPDGYGGGSFNRPRQSEGGLERITAQPPV